jgi:uncharacterized protein YfaP (DUF2135 family)
MLVLASVVPVILAATLAQAPLPSRQSGKVLGEGDTPPVIQLTAPAGGWTVDRMVTVAGTVSDRSINPVTISINGVRYLLRTTDGAFSRKFPVTSGKNAILVQGSNRGGTARAERTLHAEIPAVPLFCVLTSDTDGVYTDLHIYEPSPDAPDPLADAKDKAVHVFWAQTNSPSGGAFYLNEQGGDFDSPGYGPYLYTHTSPPLGIYRIDANYWPSGDKAHTVASLDLVLFGGTSSEIRKKVRLPLVEPGETQTLAWIRIDKGQQARIFVPSLDAKPKDNSVWPAWVLAAPTRKQGEGFDSEAEE